VRSFLIHTCEARRRGDDNAKEFYRKERCAQLRRYAGKRLHHMFAREDTNQERTKKRGHDAIDGCAEDQPSKTHLDTVDGDIGHWFPVGNDSLGNEATSSMPYELLIVRVTGVTPQRIVRNAMQPTPMPLLADESAIPTSSLPNAGLSAPFPFPQMMERSPNPPLRFAPIFEGTTIMPCYDQLSSFSSNMMNRDYLATSSLGTHNLILQASELEHQGGYRQTIDGTGAVPY